LVIEDLLLVMEERLPDSPPGPGLLAPLAVAMAFPKMRQSWPHWSTKTAIRLAGSNPVSMMNLSQPRVSTSSFRAILFT